MTDNNKRKRQIQGIQPPPAPAESGNARALKHGAYSPGVVGPIALDIEKEIMDLIRGDGLSFVKPIDQITVGGLAECLAIIRQLASYLDEHGLIVRGKLNPVLGELRGYLNSARRYCETLALTPTSRSKLGLDISRQWDFARAMAEAEAEEDVK